MVGFKSLGLAGARNALRKLFRRSPPAAESEDTSTSSSKHDSSTAQDSCNPASASNTSTTIAPASATPPVQPGDAAPVPSEPSPAAADTGNSETRTDDMAVDIKVALPAHLPKALPRNNENRFSHLELEESTEALGRLNMNGTPSSNSVVPVVSEDAEDGKPLEPMMPDLDDPAVQAERRKHLDFIGEALDMARLALKTNETPVGCVLVHNDVVIARGMNATNVTRNGTRHAEFMALSALLSFAPEKGPRTTCLRPKQDKAAQPDGASDAESMTDSGRPLPDEGNEDGRKGHLYPYGQKLHPDRKVDRAIIQESILYVTVEPCVMCASLLRQLGIKKVYFGAVNDKFGGTGGVFSIHANSLPVSEDGQTASAHPTPKPVQLPDGSGYVLGMSYPPGGGDGGNVERGYEIEGGWGRDEAVGLLRRFYVQENGRAPIPRKKEGRAARLAALLEQDGNTSNASLASQSTRDDDADDMMTEGSSRKENVDPLGEGKNKKNYGDDDEEETLML